MKNVICIENMHYFALIYVTINNINTDRIFQHIEALFVHKFREVRSPIRHSHRENINRLFDDTQLALNFTTLKSHHPTHS